MITTIQLREEVKMELARMKTVPNETYEDIIIKLIKKEKIREREKLNLLKEGYSKWAKELVKINKDWSETEAGWD